MSDVPGALQRSSARGVTFARWTREHGTSDLPTSCSISLRYTNINIQLQRVYREPGNGNPANIIFNADLLQRLCGALSPWFRFAFIS